MADGRPVPLVSIAGTKGLPVPRRAIQRLRWFARSEEWVLPSPVSVHGGTPHTLRSLQEFLEASRKIHSSGAWIATLRDVLVSPSGLVATSEGLLYESVYPWQIDSYLPRFAHDLDELSQLRSENGKIPIAHLESAFYAREGGEAGYFHFINSILPRVALYFRSKRSHDVPLLISRRQPFARDLLSAMGLPESPADRGWLRVDKLYYPSPFQLESNVFTRPLYGSRLIRELLQRFIGQRRRGHAGRRIYLSRQDARCRRIQNEAEVFALLEQHGFERIAIGRMPILDQIRLFAGASWLVSPHGAGLSNMVCMAEGSAVLEILSPARLWPSFRTLAARFGHAYHAVIGDCVNEAETAERGAGNEDFHCDPAVLSTSIAKIFGGERPFFAARKKSSRIDLVSFGYLHSAGGWVFLTSGLTPKGGDDTAASLSARFTKATLSGDALCLSLETKDGSGVTEILFLPHVADECGALRDLTLSTVRGTQRLLPAPGSAVAEEWALRDVLRSLVEGAQQGGARTILRNIIRREPWSGNTTAGRLSDIVRLEVDECILCPPRGTVLIGWMLARAGALRAVRLFSGCASWRVKFEECVRVERPDVIEKVAEPLGFDDAFPGFICFLPEAVIQGERNYLEIELTSGDTAYKNLPAPKLDGLAAIQRILGAFEVEGPAVAAAFDRIAGPSVSRLNRSRQRLTLGVTELGFGDAPCEPDYSLIVPLYGRLDYLEYQLGLLSAHPAMNRQEVLLVLDNPAQKREFLRMGESLFERFGVPFRMLITDRNTGFGSASNLGLSRARARFACFLNSDVFPGTLDWMERLIRRLDEHPALGAVGPLLLFEDGSVQHEGMDYQGHPPFTDWAFPRHPRKGMRPPEESGLRICPAITAACMVFETKFIRDLGGFNSDYIIGDFEDSDLCLRIRRVGRQCAVDLDVRLYHLERKSQAENGQRWRRNLTLYNAWVHRQRWPELPVEQPFEAVTNGRLAAYSALAEPVLQKRLRDENSPMRVLIASHSHPKLVNGGAERAAFELFNGLQKSGRAETWFLACERNEEARRSGRVLAQPFTNREFVYATGDFQWFNFANRDPVFLRELGTLVRALRPEIVHFHHYAQLGVEALRHVRVNAPDAKLVLTLHEYLAICHQRGQMVTKDDQSLCRKASPSRCQGCFPALLRSDFFLRDLYIRRFFDIVDCFIAPSSFLADRYIAWGLPEEKFTVMENALAEPECTGGRTQALKSEILRAGFFGQISVLKGIEVLMEAAEILERERETRVVFEIYGDYRNQGRESKERFLQLLSAAPRNVHYHGPYENESIDELMQSVDMVVVPSIWWENSPMVIQEALRNIRPVICSGIGGMAEKVRDGVDGFHFPAGSPTGLAEVLRRLAADRSQLDRIRTTMAVPAAAQQIVAEHLLLYGKLLRGEDV